MLSWYGNEQTVLRFLNFIYILSVLVYIIFFFQYFNICAIFNQQQYMYTIQQQSPSNKATPIKGHLSYQTRFQMHWDNKIQCTTILSPPSREVTSLIRPFISLLFNLQSYNWETMLKYIFYVFIVAYLYNYICI